MSDDPQEVMDVEEEKPKRRRKPKGERRGKASAALQFLPDQSTFFTIKNKQRRQEEWRKIKKEKKKAKSDARDAREKERKALGDKAPPKQIPNTLDNTREKDPTVLQTGENGEVDEEVEKDLTQDEFSTYFERSYVPKVLITSSELCQGTKTRAFMKELERIIPNGESIIRKNKSSVKKMVEEAKERNYSDILIINEDRKKPNGLLVIHLPDGPTGYFKLTNLKTLKCMKRPMDHITLHRPEVILNNFTTRLGHGIARMLASLFHYDPEFRGKRVATFHNQRDYIFFRHHQYHIKSEDKVRLHELGPRFTLKLKWLQEGTFDTKYGEYEWNIADKRHQLETGHRKRFYL